MQLAIDWTNSHGFNFFPRQQQCFFGARVEWTTDSFRHLHTLYESSIPTDNKIKFLVLFWTIGPIQYTFIIWKHHVSESLISSITSKTWIADLKFHLRLYITLILSKLDYDRTVYGQTSPSLLRLLDFVQNRYKLFNRLPRKVWRWKKISCLTLRRELLICRIFLRFQTTQNSAIASLIWEVSIFPVYWQFAIVVHTILIYPKVLFYAPAENCSPWMHPVISICLFIDISFQVYSFFSAPACPSLPKHVSFYIPSFTDGSKSDEGVGASTVIPDRILLHCLPLNAYIFTAKLTLQNNQPCVIFVPQ